MVFYRKYRPQKISELDSTKARESLQSIFSTKRLNPASKTKLDAQIIWKNLDESIPHAFLFTGPKGLGKTSTARIIAKAVNCENPQIENDLIEPCGICFQCKSITEGTNIDVLEIDGASNRGIDEIRDLRERVKLAPSNARKKVYIIDEVHMLTQEAFNALLKTIEEPPAHVMFIFCTTEPQKVPATILSRCFHIAFERATDEEIVRSLERIVDGEKIQIAKKDMHSVLYGIAKKADGGFRDGSKLLEELFLLSDGKEITIELYENIHKTAATHLAAANLLSVLNPKQLNARIALANINEIFSAGVDFRIFISEALSLLHLILLSKMDVKKENFAPGLGDFEVEDIRDLSDLLGQAYEQSRHAVIPQLPLEMAVITWGEMNKNKSGYLEKGDQVQPNKLSGKLNMDTLAKQQQSLKVKQVLYPASKADLEDDKKKNSFSHSQNDINSIADENTTLLENIIYKVKPFNHSVAGVLRGCKVKQLTESGIFFETPYKFHKERLEEKKTCEIIEKAVKDITGKSLKINVNLIDKK